MKTKLLLLAALAFVSISSFGQTTLYYDNFNPATYPSPDATANVNFSGGPSTASSISSALHTYTGFNASVAGWFTTSANGASGLNSIWTALTSTYSTNLSIQGTTAAPSGGAANQYRGVATIAMPMSGFATGFNTKLSANTGVLTWSFAMRLNKSSALTPLNYALKPSTTTSGQLAAGLILATNAAASDPIATTGTDTGYAVLLTGSDVYSALGISTVNQLTFGAFDGGLVSDGSATTAATTTSFRPLLTIDNLTAGSSSAISVIVTYDPATNKWSLSTRQDLANSLQDPLATTANTYSTPITVVNNDYTDQVNTNMMAYYNIGGTTGFYMDNLKVVTSANLGVAQNEIEGLKVYPNPVSNGALYIDSDNNSSAKNVTIFDMIGKQVLAKEVSNGAVNVSNLAKGNYVVKIAEGEKSSVKKIVIE